jgi:hypothetical protein
LAPSALRANSDSDGVQSGYGYAGGRSAIVTINGANRVIILGPARPYRDRVCQRRTHADFWIGCCFDGIGTDEVLSEGRATTMIPAPSGARVWLASGHTDMRKGVDEADATQAETVVQMAATASDKIAYLRAMPASTPPIARASAAGTDCLSGTLGLPVLRRYYLA